MSLLIRVISLYLRIIYISKVVYKLREAIYNNGCSDINSAFASYKGKKMQHSPHYKVIFRAIKVIIDHNKVRKVFNLYNKVLVKLLKV